MQFSKCIQGRFLETKGEDCKQRSCRMFSFLFLTLNKFLLKLRTGFLTRPPPVLFSFSPICFILEQTMWSKSSSCSVLHNFLVPEEIELSYRPLENNIFRVRRQKGNVSAEHLCFKVFTISAF